MQLEVKIEKKYKEILVQIWAGEMNRELRELLQKLENTPAETLAGFREGRAELLKSQDIQRVYTENQHVYAQTQQGIYQVKLRLYEVEARLDEAQFVRISQAELVNIGQIADMDLSLAGTILMRLKNGQQCFVSRRQVPAIRSKLGL